jgi:hypothetical protein
VYKLANVNAVLFFPAVDEAHGMGLWAISSEQIALGVVPPTANSGLLISRDDDADRDSHPCDGFALVFGLAGDRVVDGGGTSKLDVARPIATGGLLFSLDSNGTLTFEPVLDVIFNFGRATEEILAGDWNSFGTSKIGVTRPNPFGGLVFSLDFNGNNAFDPSVDAVFNFGLERDQVFAADWTGDSISKLGVAQPNGTGRLVVALDTNGNFASDLGIDRVFNFGLAGDKIDFGKWGTSGDALTAVTGAATGFDPRARLTTDVLPPVVEQATSNRIDAGIDPSTAGVLCTVAFVITELPEAMLGLSAGDIVYIDTNAAGYGWFVDPTPEANEEFVGLDGDLFAAIDEGPAAERMDLRSVVLHEIGRILGFDHASSTDSADDIMADDLPPGVRRVPTANSLDAFFASDLLDDMLP